MAGHLLHNVIAPQPLHMRNLPASNTTYLPSSCDEELVDEADEPPDNCHSRLRTSSFSDGDFSKQPVPHSPPVESLLSRALLTSPTLRPVDRIPRNNPTRGMSTCSTWSNASTAELTSDGLTTPSRANTPSPPPPLYLTGIASLLDTPKPRPHVLNFEPVEIASSTTGVHDSSDCQGRRRCITFAMDRRNSEDGVKQTEADGNKQELAPKRPGLTFICNQSEARRNSLHSTTQSPDSVEIRGRSMSTSAAAGMSTIPSFNPFVRPGSIRFYDSEDPGDSWTHEPFDRTRLLKVDDVLKKERDIRKLSEEAEAEEMEENEEGLDDDDDETSVGDDEDANGSDLEDEDELEVEEDEEDDGDGDSYDGESGNETDNEEGFGDDESDDELFFTHPHRQPLPIPFGFNEPPHPPQVYQEPSRPQCCRSHSDTSTDWRPRTAPRRIRPPPPELPDSTDFVCGTLDEDKALEQAYVSCLEERKRSKHKPVPQDIDPSFPTSDPEESDEEVKPRKGKTEYGRSASPANIGLKNKHRDGGRSPPPRGRVHSPAPIRRRVQSPTPLRCSNNNSPQSRPVSPGTRRGRAMSPAPTRAPAARVPFNSDRNIVRTRSLPRTTSCVRRTYRNTKHRHTSTSPHQAATRPVLIRRGAMDIYKSLEKRRERRKARLQRKDKDCDRKAGEGVEKMRELGLEVCGKGKARPAQWVISA